MMQNKTYPGYIGVSDVTTTSFEAMRVEGYFDGQPSLMFDEPCGFDITGPTQSGAPGDNLSGQSRGWTPVHAQLAALAACTSITIAVVARDQGFCYSGLRTAVRSLIDIRGFFFDLDQQPRYEQLNFDLWLETPETDARIAALAAETHRRCPQLGLFRLARIPLLVEWYRADEAAPCHTDRLSFPDGSSPEERLVQQGAG